MQLTTMAENLRNERKCERNPITCTHTRYGASSSPFFLHGSAAPPPSPTDLTWKALPNTICRSRTRSIPTNQPAMHGSSSQMFVCVCKRVGEGAVYRFFTVTKKLRRLNEENSATFVQNRHPCPRRKPFPPNDEYASPGQYIFTCESEFIWVPVKLFSKPDETNVFWGDTMFAPPLKTPRPRTLR